MNAADEVAVEWFLEGRIQFTTIPRIIERVLSAHEAGPGDSIAELLAVDRRVRESLEQEEAKWTGSGT